ncbi:hypothetical protein [Marininema halotolerans]|uniref:Uncharacterized protein n=1 Tax=Marininema halotolerans TaxID=1155944 RepID=A0A1I6P0I9_9BACL|nr:hypothetical protein [Marininema halotolerans]SFS33645.1 hypothetical protein SAMN05444972_101274 [Marininema halotolerans]
MVFIGISPIYQECVDLNALSLRYVPQQEPVVSIQVNVSKLKRYRVGLAPPPHEKDGNPEAPSETSLAYQLDLWRGPPYKKKGPDDAGSLSVRKVTHPPM